MKEPDKIRRFVARKHGLTDDERGELRGRTLSELLAHAEHIVGRRKHVEAFQERNPGAPTYAVEGAYDGGGFDVRDGAGREAIAEAFADRVRSGGPQTTGFLARVAENTAASTRRPANEDAAERRERIRERLENAGYGTGEGGQ